MKEKEIERTFCPDPRIAQLHATLIGAEQESIDQGYLFSCPGHGVVRLRRRETECILTVKKGRDDERDEYESIVPEELFDQLWPATEGARLSKSRHTTRFRTDGVGDVALEVDEYTGDLTGLFLIKVGIDSRGVAASFTPPEWFGEEVTGDERYLDRSLATQSTATASVAPAMGPAR